MAENYPKLVESHAQIIEKLNVERAEKKKLLMKLKDLKKENLSMADDLRLFYMKDELTPRPNFDKIYM